VRRGLALFLGLEDDIVVVGQAADGGEAVAQAAALQPDVVVMDVVMPGIDGLAATRTLTEAHPGTKVLVLSSFGDHERVTAVLKAGASGYLLKDTEPEQLAEAIRAVHRGDAVIPADRAREALDLLPQLPRGSLTIVFTDIQGSTQLVERLGDERARDVLRAHDRVVRAVLTAHGGVEVEHEGDSFMLAFMDAAAAVRFAIELQRELERAAELRSGRDVRVRVGMNSGAVIAEPAGYFGRTVYVAARVAALAEGGQILISDDTHELVKEEWGCSPAGVHELRGLTGAHALYEVPWS
jgi:class 3 adenylate cyclase